MGASLRLFVALVLNEATRALLAAEVERVHAWAPRARTVAPQNLHVTLAFLGATPEEDAAAVEGALRLVAGKARPLAVRVAGFGAFPSEHHPRVLWAGLEETDRRGALADLAEAVGRALEEAGHPIDRPERFHPHVTLARLEGRRPSEALEKGLTRGTLQNTYKAEVLSDLVLMVSERDGHGVRYRPLATFPLGASSGA